MYYHLKVTLEALSEGTSGLINSDWHVLKFSGYMMKEDDEPKGMLTSIYSAINSFVLNIPYQI